MRHTLLLAVATLLAVSCNESSQSDPTGREIAPEELAAMIAIDPEGGLQCDPPSIYANSQAIDRSADPDDEVLDVRTFRRVTGYARECRRSDRYVRTTVSLFEDAEGASGELRDRIAELSATIEDFSRPPGPLCNSPGFGMAPQFEIQQLADESAALLVVDLTVAQHGHVLFRRGRLVGHVCVSPDREIDPRTQAEAHARALDERILAIVNGEIAVPPLATATGVSAGDASQLPPSDVRLIVRRTSSAGGDHHVFYVTDLDGSNARQFAELEPGASLIGFVGTPPDAGLVYFARAAPGSYVIRRRDRGGGARDLVTVTTDAESGVPTASLSPDGRYLAYDQEHLHLDLLDVVTGETRRLLSGELGCPGTDPLQEGECFRFGAPRWSPDGRWLLAVETLYEAEINVIIDPFVVDADFVALPYSWSSASWSPSSEAVCRHFGDPAASGGLLVAHAPAWQPRPALTKFEAPSVTECAWVSDRDIIVVTSLPEPAAPGGIGIALLEAESGQFGVLATVADPPIDVLVSASGDLIERLVGASGDLLIFNGCRYQGNAGPAQPCVLDLAQQIVIQILEPVDQILGLIGTEPHTLARHAMPFTGDPCPELTPGCEARVTNVAPGQLNVRDGPLADAAITDGLAEGELVCLLQGSSWPRSLVRSSTGVEGWVAGSDPDTRTPGAEPAPDHQWLTPTGRKCQ